MHDGRTVTRTFAGGACETGQRFTDSARIGFLHHGHIALVCRLIAARPEALHAA